MKKKTLNGWWRLNLMEKDDSIFLAGHRGLVGSAILRRLEAEGFTRLLTRTRAELDLTRQRGGR